MSILQAHIERTRLTTHFVLLVALESSALLCEGSGVAVVMGGRCFADAWAVADPHSGMGVGTSTLHSTSLFFFGAEG